MGNTFSSRKKNGEDHGVPGQDGPNVWEQPSTSNDGHHLQSPVEDTEAIVHDGATYISYKDERVNNGEEGSDDSNCAGPGPKAAALEPSVGPSRGRNLKKKKKKEISCQECGKVYSKSLYLKKHIKVHKGKQVYKCKHCGKGFMKGSSLKTHLIAHVGIRSFACSVCERSFTRKWDMQRHELNVHGLQRPYACKRCQKTYKEKASLVKHLKNCRKA